jgi:outer membrane protein
MTKSNWIGLLGAVNQMLQSHTPTKWLGIFLALLGANFAALAQSNSSYTMPGTNALTVGTNVLIPATTNIPATYTNALTTYTNAPATNVVDLSLTDCIQMTLQHNLELQIARYNPQIALYALRSAYGAYDPSFFMSGQHSHAEGGATVIGTNVFSGRVSEDNSFSGSVGGLTPFGTSYTVRGSADDNYGTLNEVSSSAAAISLTQPLLKNFWINGPQLIIRVDKNRLKYSELGLKLSIMTTITSLEQAYYDLIYDREYVAVQQQAVELAEALVNENQTRLRFGALAPLDLAAAQAQAAQSRSAVIAAKSRLGTQERALKLYITENIGEWADVAIEPSGSLTATYREFNRQKSWKSALTQHPQMLQAKLDVERAGIQLKYDRNQLFPELDVFATYGYNGVGKEFSGSLYDLQQRDLNAYVYGGRITVPLGNITARNTYKLDKATLQQMVLTVKTVERNLMIAVDNDIGTLQADYDQVLATRAQRMYEEQALDAEQKKLQNGKSTTYQVLLVQRDLTTARGNEIQALATYNKDLARLSLDEGTTLERLHINLDVK